MIEALRIKNFQVHKNLVIDLDRITTIVGPSDRGKSAVIRALRWLCFNKPGGTAFIREGSEFTKVQVDVDGHKITRTRGRKNRYTLDGKDLVSFGANVPDMVTELLNVGPDNFQRQHDSPFWFAESAGEVSRKLNTIIDLGIIDDALSYANGQLRKARSHVSMLEDEAHTARLSREGLEWVPECARDWAQLQSKATKQLQTRSRMHGLASLVGEATKYAQNIDSAAGRSSGARSVLDVGARYMKTREEAAGLRASLDSLTRMEDQLCQLRKRRGKLERSLPRICPTCGSTKNGTTTGSPS